ncbi:ATP-binding protein (plasmid) [Cetobacterium somerae]|uniref:AAA family ATPase n=1 Tax=Cetobacterium somerae TaxID=188913 RepID=UPI001F062072|nr:AAA family ATPase [Cetobacterium somerae]UPO98878.1 ATP-binding protein [Cetobacterium somerae]
MVKKKLPVGIDNFKEIIENNYYFVDKSMMIDELLNKKSKVTLLPRPRRFGKTLNMSMLNYFFNIEDKEANRNLFNGLDISNTDKMMYQGEYPVIYVSLKDIKVSNWVECFEEIKKLLKDIFNTKRYIREKLDESEKIDFDRIEFLNETGDFVGALKNLSKYLFKFYGKKVIILIDEYDTPLVTAHSQGYYDDAIFFFRNFLSAALKGNPYLEFSVLTCILRVAKESIFSELNNLSVSTILDSDFNYFGLTTEEVEEALKYYGLDYELEGVKRWYNGYTFGGKLVYNPWSLINFINKNVLGAYWINTSDNALIKQLLDKNDKKVFEELEMIFKGEVIWETISENIIFDDLNNTNTIWSLMLFSGYLTYEKMRISPITELKSYSLKIPNVEIKSFFRQSFIESYTKGDVHFYGTMIEDLFLGELNSFVNKFKRMYLSAVSYHDAGDSEKYYHHFMLGLLLTLGDKYIITSNRESGYGRYDIALEPKDKKNFGLIFEFKIGDKNSIGEKAKEALAQIDEKKYDISMKNNGVSKVIKIGMAFSGKDVAIESEIN